MNLVWKTKMIGFFRAPWDVRLKNMYASRRKKNSTEKIRPTKLQQYKIEKLIQFVLNVYVVL